MCLSLLHWHAAIRCVFDHPFLDFVSNFVGGLAIFVQFMLLRLLSSPVRINCVLTVYSVLCGDGIGWGRCMGRGMLIVGVCEGPIWELLLVTKLYHQ
jgi:hypothetical protein